MRLLLFLLLFSTIARAQGDQYVIDAGLGVFNSGKNSLAETKTISLAIQEDLWDAIKDRLNIGGWIDNTGGGRSSSAFTSAQVGFEVNSGGTVASIFTGPCLISSPDAYLGGYFQFMSDLHLGLQDNGLNYIGVMYRHISSAGLETPNTGRDIVGLEIRW